MSYEDTMSYYRPKARHRPLFQPRKFVHLPVPNINIRSIVRLFRRQAGDALKATEVSKLIAESLAIEEIEAKEAGALGYMARILVQATMPHSKMPEFVYERRNGSFQLVMMANPAVGLPYGTKPRLLLSWLTTEAVRTRERTLVLGDSLSSFMRQLGLVPTGGRWGSITTLKQQTKRLFASTVHATYDDGDQWELEAVNIADHASFWWSPKSPQQLGMWQSTVTLSERFFREVINAPVPIDMRALHALSRSPLALDIYCWLTYRMSYLKRRTEVPWGALALQFGANYSSTRYFKRSFNQQLRKVLVVYPEATVEEGVYGLVLKPSVTSVRRLPKA